MNPSIEQVACDHGVRTPSCGEGGPGPLILTVVLFLYPLTASAEVMDKERVPWNPVMLGGIFLVSFACSRIVTVAAKSRYLIGKVAWGVAAIALATVPVLLLIGHDFYAADIGPAMRQELGEPQSSVYAILLPFEAVLPAVATLATTAFWAWARRSSTGKKGRA